MGKIMSNTAMAMYRLILTITWSVRGLDNWMIFLLVCFFIAHGAWTIGLAGFIFAWLLFGAIFYFFLSVLNEKINTWRYMLLWPFGFVSTSARRWMMDGPFLSKYRYAVWCFHYDGIGGFRRPKYAPFTAEFVRWTSDPGVAEMKCSDNQIRLVPGWAIDSQYDLPPMPDYSKTIRNFGFVHIGLPSHYESTDESVDFLIFTRPRKGDASCHS